MSTSLNLKKTLFGLKPSEVQIYLESVSKEIEEKISYKIEEIESLKKQNEQYSDQIKALQFKVDKAAQEKERIAEAFLKAENSANEIVNSAQQTAEKMIAEAKAKADQMIRAAERKVAEYQSEMEREFRIQKMELEAQKRQVLVMRENITRTLEKFDDTLEKIVE